MMSRIRSRRPSVRAKVVIGCRGARKVRSLPRGSYFVCSVVQSVAAPERLAKLAMPLDSTAPRRGQELHLRYKKGGNRKAFQHLSPVRFSPASGLLHEITDGPTSRQV